MQGFLYFLLMQMKGFGINPFKGITDFIKVTLPYGIPADISNTLGSIFDSEYDLVASGGGLQDIFQTYVDPASSLYSSIWTYVKTAHASIAIIGCSLTILFWFLSIVDKLTKDRLTGYELIRSGIEIVVAFMFIVEGFNIFTGLQAISTDIYNNLSSTNIQWDSGSRDYTLFFGANKTYGAANTNDWASLNAWDIAQESSSGCRVHGWSGMVAMFIPLIKVCIMSLGAQVGCIIGVAVMVSRVIQMGVYMILSPIAIADLFNGGIMNSPGFRFLKKFFAICLQGAVIYVIMMVTMSLQKSFLSSLNGNAFMLLVPSLVMISLILKAQQITNDIVGV